jgi:hypothetical protein
MSDYVPDERVTLSQRAGAAQEPTQRTLTLQEAVRLVSAAPLGSIERTSSIIMRQDGQLIEDLAEIDDIHRLLNARLA